MLGSLHKFGDAVPSKQEQRKGDEENPPAIQRLIEKLPIGDPGEEI